MGRAVSLRLVGGGQWAAQEEELSSMRAQSQTIDMTVKRHSHTIAAQVLFFRLHRGLSQKKLGEMCGMKQAAIARLEHTPDVKWTSRTLMKIAAALDIRVSVDVIPNEDLQPLLDK